MSISVRTVLNTKSAVFSLLELHLIWAQLPGKAAPSSSRVTVLIHLYTESAFSRGCAKGLLPLDFHETHSQSSTCVHAMQHEDPDLYSLQALCALLHHGISDEVHPFTILRECTVSCMSAGASLALGSPGALAA